MGYPQYLRPSFSEALGKKVKHGVDMFEKAKALYDTGKPCSVLMKLQHM